MPRGQNVLCGIDVCVLAVVAGHASEDALRPSVRRRLVAALATRTAGVARIYPHHCAAYGRQLVRELASKLAPTLIENRPIETGLLAHPGAGLRHGSTGRGTHHTDPQVFNRDDRMF